MTDNLSWQQLAIRDLEETDLSYAEIGEKYGRERDTIVKLKQRYDVTRKVGSRKGNRPARERKERSPLHRAVGIRLSLYKDRKSYSQVAAELNLSTTAVRYIELGVFDLTLDHLIRLAEVMGMSVTELVTPLTSSMVYNSYSPRKHL